MPLRTALTELLPGLRAPIICGGMQHVGTAELAAAVCRAGGLGVVTALTQPKPELLRAEIRRTRALVGESVPFAVNLAILPMLIPADYSAYVDVICEERVAAIEISAGSPRKFMPRLRAAGVKVIHKVATVAHALKAEAVGVDLIEIAGFEASIAGYAERDFVGTWVLLAKALAKLRTPVVVSGSTCTGRQLAAALAMGAAGVVMGTRFLATQECPIMPALKTHLASPAVDEYSTAVVLHSLGNGTRVYRNGVAKSILALEAREERDFDKYKALASGERTKTMWAATGDPQGAMWSVGQGAGLVEDVPTCEELVARVVREAEECLRAAAACAAPTRARL